MSEFASNHEISATPVPYVVHGSFRKHLGAISMAIETLNNTGAATAIAPHDCNANGSEAGFVKLTGEQDLNPLQIEADYLRKVLSLKAENGFSLWVNPSGYIGKAAAYEYGVAQACGITAYFTEAPDDVPFYVDQSHILTIEDLASRLQKGTAPNKTPSAEGPVDVSWFTLPFPTAAVAIGGIVKYKNKILLVEDGRWQGNKLTVPGTKVRAHESRSEALRRLFNDKIGTDINNIAPLLTSFMIDGSGYRNPTHELVFDDRLIAAASDKIHTRHNIKPHWTPIAEAQKLSDAGELEPNAATLLMHYLATAT